MKLPPHGLNTTHYFCPRLRCGARFWHLFYEADADINDNVVNCEFVLQ